MERAKAGSSPDQEERLVKVVLLPPSLRAEGIPPSVESCWCCWNDLRDRCEARERLEGIRATSRLPTPYVDKDEDDGSWRRRKWIGKAGRRRGRPKNPEDTLGCPAVLPTHVVPSYAQSGPPSWLKRSVGPWVVVIPKVVIHPTAAPKLHVRRDHHLAPQDPQC